MIHYRINKKDRKIWGSSTICGVSMGGMSGVLSNVTCKSCIKMVSWDEDKFLDARANILQL